MMVLIHFLMSSFFLFVSLFFSSQRAEAKLAEMEMSLQELNALSKAVAEFFCEDPAAFKLEDCCSIFNSFCRRFETAVQVKKKRNGTQSTDSIMGP